ncbi:MAG: sigma-70 family RNA polymerase sigma factor [Planctomycetes bacterium]|nr:sigma-70 family RNA polymerase sigma factor [Planctomycetota bacterium]
MDETGDAEAWDQTLKKSERIDGAALLTRIAKGDEAALEEFYEAYFPRLYRFVFYRVRCDHQHSEEVIHDTFMEALENAGKYNPSRGSVESWLITLSRNRIRSLNALMNRPLEYEKSWSMVEGELESLFAYMDAGNFSSSAPENEYLRTLVGAVMGSIPEEYSRLLEMKYISELTIRDIAGAIHKTEKSVESQLTRARSAFRDAFKTITAVPAADMGL